MKISPSDFESIIINKIETYDNSVAMDEIGRVSYVADGIAFICGLSNAGILEILEFEGGARGIALNLERDIVGAVIFGSVTKVTEGSIVKRTKKMISTKVGKEMLGRVINAIGEELDGKGKIKSKEERFIFEDAPGIIDRKSVSQPLQTGIKGIDALIPIGLGQRELVLGDRQTGKTSLAIDTILNQKRLHDMNDPERVYCVYVAIGQKRSTIARIVDKLQSSGAMAYTTVVSASASDSSADQFIAPYVGTSIAEYFRDNGMHALVIYDDLSKHAVAHREISLLLRRPPGREAYPGDVFYIHSSLLERSAKLSDAKGGGSLTSIPIVQTQDGDLSAYIPTNIISITDGQIFLEAELFNKGIRPAINYGSSVSRVGSAAQTKAIKKISSGIKLDLAQFREVEAFSKFSSDLDESTLALLEKGGRLVEFFKQELNSPLSLSEQVIALYCSAKGYLIDIKLNAVPEFEKHLLSHFKSQYNDFMTRVDKVRKLDDKSDYKILDKGIKEAKESFAG